MTKRKNRSQTSRNPHNNKAQEFQPSKKEYTLLEQLQKIKDSNNKALRMAALNQLYKLGEEYLYDLDVFTLMREDPGCLFHLTETLSIQEEEVEEPLSQPDTRTMKVSLDIKNVFAIQAIDEDEFFAQLTETSLGMFGQSEQKRRKLTIDDLLNPCEPSVSFKK